MILLVVTPLHLGVIFYERNGSDKKRTLINKLFSSICRYVIVLNSSVQVATIFRLIVGPFQVTSLSIKYFSLDIVADG